TQVTVEYVNEGGAMV
nr:RecName: Full=Unknown protein from spot 445 of 2D-PAGE of etiolated coleoptile [Zea mays]